MKNHDFLPLVEAAPRYTADDLLIRDVSEETQQA